MGMDLRKHLSFVCHVARKAPLISVLRPQEIRTVVPSYEFIFASVFCSRESNDTSVRFQLSIRCSCHLSHHHFFSSLCGGFVWQFIFLIIFY